MNRKYLMFFAAILCAVAAAGQTTPEKPEEVSKPSETEKPDTVQKVTEDVVVSATREKRSPADVPVSVTVISSKDVESTPAHALDDVLRNVPGLNLPGADSLLTIPHSDHLSMRGLGGNRALVMVDGAPVNDPFSGDINWNRISHATIDRIEIARGGAASLYGNYAMTGTVDVFTRPADEQRVWADAAYGSYNTGRVDAAVDQPLAPGLGFGVNVDTFDSDGFYRVPADQRGKIDIPFYSRNRLAGLRFDGAPADGPEWFARGNYFDTHISQGSPLSFDRKDGFDGSAGARWKDTFGGDISANLFALRQEFDTNNSSLVAGQGRNAEFLSNSHVTPSQRIGGSLQWTRDFSTVVPFVTAGIDVQRILAEDRVDNFSSSGALRGTLRAGGRQDFGGVFIEGDFFPEPKLEILASARLDLWRNFDGHNYLSTGPDAFYAGRSAAELDPRLSLRLDLGHGWAARAAAYRAFGAPTLDVLYESATTKTSTIVPNPSLGPEILLGGEVGLDYVRGPFSAQVNVFQNRVTNLITSVTVATTPTVLHQSINVGASRSRGVELIGQTALGPHWRLDAGYTYTDPRIIDNPPDRTLEGNLIEQVPRNFASASATYVHSAGWTATLRGRYFSRSYQDSSNLIALDPATVLDAFFALPLGSSFDLTFTGENILDRRYVSDASQGARIGAPAMYLVGIRLHPMGSAASKRSPS